MNKKFDFTRLDCEERFGIASAGMTAAGKFASFIPGVILTAVFYGILSLLRLIWSNTVFIEMFFPGGAGNRTLIPALTVFCAMWCFSMIVMKRSKIRVQQKLFKALMALPTVAERVEFVGQNVVDKNEFAAAKILMQSQAMEAKNLVDSEKALLIDSFIGDLEKASDSSFINISAFIWAIPVLGFIGTVLGLAKAVGNFGELASANGGSGFQAVLPQVTGGLATAFETTLTALSLALILQLLSSFIRHAEELFLQQLKLLLNDTSENSDPDCETAGS